MQDSIHPNIKLLKPSRTEREVSLEYLEDALEVFKREERWTKAIIVFLDDADDGYNVKQWSAMRGSQALALIEVFKLRVFKFMGLLPEEE